jgi:hypothetical protein
MTRERVIKGLVDLADRLGTIAEGTEWHLFGSADHGKPTASDIDLLILCASDAQADALRLSIDSDSLSLPLHLSLMTYNEAAEVDAVWRQRARMIFQAPVGRFVRNADLGRAAQTAREGAHAEIPTKHHQ